MGLKCSLFGHAFDERDVVRERDSTGSEVVTVVKDVERCTQCGAERVVSTNKEVVSASGATADGGVSADASIGTPGDGPTAGADGDDAAPSAGGLGGMVDRSDAADAGDDAFDDTGFEAGAADAGDESAVEADLDPELEDDPDPATDDAEILTDESTAPGDRAPGRWPGDETPDAWEPEPLDGADGEDDPDAATDAPDDGDEPDPTDEDAEVLGDADGAGAAPRDDAGETPDTVAEPAPEPEPAATATFTVPDGHYRCGDCGHTIPATSSFRAGDACPECVGGYLEDGE
jgi:hypothetical protein